MAQVGLLEDNLRIAKLCATLLQHAGHQVCVYEHPQACLDALLSAALPFGKKQAVFDAPPVDVLILDLHLPDIAGIDVLHSLISHPTTQSLPLICCSAATSAEISKALSIAPKTLFVEKPFTYQDLVAAVASVLGLPDE
jgi:CheY-like chemotaxis protein